MTLHLSKDVERREDISDDITEIMRKLDDSEMGKLFDYFEQTREEVIEGMDETNDIFDSTNHERISTSLDTKKMTLLIGETGLTIPKSISKYYKERTSSYQRRHLYLDRR